MANPKHLEILKQGVEVWNRWREENPEIEPDLNDANLLGENLIGAYLRGVHFRGTNLSLANVTGANLSFANLVGANLFGARLKDAKLKYAKLKDAKLRSANFISATLIGADLRNVDLRNADLIGANLHRAQLLNAILYISQLTSADLSEADLSEADLSEADLSHANLSHAKLISANLSGARLIGANLFGAELIGADLKDAKLRSANLNSVNLSNVNLLRANLQDTEYTNSNINRTIFANTDLGTAKGLDSVTHSGPSEISISTLYKSAGNIPESFLRGCGLSDWEIESAKLYNPDLNSEEINDIQYRIHDLRVSRAFQINPLFISYSHSDSPFIDKIEKRLTDKGIRFWRDIHHAKAGRLEKQINQAIQINDVVLLVLSKHSTNSDWVEHETRKAREKEKSTGKDALCPVALDDSWKTCRWPERLREQIIEYNILDFSNWHDESVFQKMFGKLLEGLNLFYK